jgi:LysR family transcriptional activator of nhaA
LDLLISDSPAMPGLRVRVFSHLLGESSLSVFGSAELAAKYSRDFPDSLAEAPFLLPTPNMVQRRAIDQWFDERGWQPRIAAEIEDNALLKTFGQAGHGLFFASSAIEPEIRKQYKVRVVGRLETVRERFYAITPERRIKHPAAAAISDQARRKLFR